MNYCQLSGEIHLFKSLYFRTALKLLIYKSITAVAFSNLLVRASLNKDEKIAIVSIIVLKGVSTSKDMIGAN
jgi:hypothetical protein